MPQVFREGTSENICQPHIVVLGAVPAMHVHISLALDHLAIFHSEIRYTGPAMHALRSHRNTVVSIQLAATLNILAMGVDLVICRENITPKSRVVTLENNNPGEWQLAKRSVQLGGLEEIIFV